MRGLLKKVYNKTADFFELYIPGVFFIIMFIFYIVMIAYRYIFYKQISSIFELSVILFLWICVLSASYGGRSKKHIMFAILYDKVSEKIKLIFRLIGNLVIIITFIILIPFTYESNCFYAIKKSSMLKIPFNVIYFPFILFLISTLIHYFILFIKDIKLIKNLWKGQQK